MLFVESFLIGLAANLAFALMQAGSARLKRALLGTLQEQALQRAYQAAFEAALRASAPAGDEASARRVADHLQRFLALPDVADTLLDMALAGSLAPDLDLLSERYASLDSGGDAPPIDITHILVVFHGRLTTALMDEASAADSPLYNQVSLARMRTIHGLLRGQQHSLRQVSHLLQRLEAQPGIYNIIIEQATGVAIGDGATVNQFPEDVRLALAEVLAAVRELNAQRWLPAYSFDDLHSYLETVIERCQTLELQSAGGPVDKLPLERVYVALKADASNAAERRANYRQFLDDLAAYEQELAVVAGLDEHTRYQIKRAVARGLDPMGLTLPLRNRASAEQGDYLAQAAQRIDLGELVGQKRWAVLLGDPGAGKTTLIRWLAMQFARSLLVDETRVRVPGEQVRADAYQQTAQEWADLGPARLPVPLRLADYAAARWPEGKDTALTLFQYLGKQPWLGRPLHPDQAVGQAIVQDALRQDRALILLDGLDEIADQYRRGQVIDAIVHFLRTWVRDPISGLCAAEEGYAPPQEREEERPWTQGGNQVLITSRPIGYYLAPLPATLAHYTVEEMSEPAIAGFCQAWTAAVHEQTGQGDPAADAETLRMTVLDPARPALCEIASNPLLLTILAGLFYTLKGRLPERRVEIYGQVVQAFTRQRHDAWVAQGLSDERFRFALGYVASRLHASPDARFANGLAGDADVKQWLRQALRVMDGKHMPAHREQAALLFASAAGLGGFLLERGDGAYGFIHRALQEYFAALYLADDPDRVAEEVCSRLDDPAWREPLVLAVAQIAGEDSETLPGLLQAIQDAPEPAPGLLPSNALFLATCFIEFKEPPPAEIVAQAVGQLLAAYADRAWPDDETTRPPTALRTAIECSLRPLRAQPGAHKALAAALQGDDPAQRLAAAELILTLKWRQPALVAPLLTAARDYSEPVATVREALWEQVEAHPNALAGQILPLRRLLAEQEAAEQPWWRAILRTLYLRPDWSDEKPLTAAAVCFDSQLSPWLERAWRDGWSRERLAETLVGLARETAAPALARDAAWALAVVDEERWRAYLAAVGDRAALRLTLAGLAWQAANRSFGLYGGYQGDLYATEIDRDREHLPDHPQAIVLVNPIMITMAIDLDLEFSVDLAYAGNLAKTLHHARWINLDFARVLTTYQNAYHVVTRPRCRNDDLHIKRELVSDRDLDEMSALIKTACVETACVEMVGQVGAEEALAALSRVEVELAALREWLQGPTWRALANAGEVATSWAESKGLRRRRLPWSSELAAKAARSDAELLTRLKAPDKWDEPTLREQARAIAMAWLAEGEERLQRLGALLLAEMGEATEKSLPRLLALLGDGDDLARARARAALQQGRAASQWPKEMWRALAGYALGEGQERPKGEERFRAATYCRWALNAVEHDRPEWLQAWAGELEGQPSEVLTALLSSIRRLEAGSWPAFLELLAAGGERTRKALIESASWLLRLGRVPEDKHEALGEVLLELARAEEAAVAQVAVLALGCFQKPPQRVVDSLMRKGEWFIVNGEGGKGHCHRETVNGQVATGNWEEGSGKRTKEEREAVWGEVWRALARLAPRLDEAGQRMVDALLLAAAPGAAVDGALARLAVKRQLRCEYFDPVMVPEELAAWRPGARTLLQALLAAGTDDDEWDDQYHGWIARAVNAMLQSHTDLWPLLVDELRTGLEADDSPLQRIALASLARCAEAMPQQFNRSATDLAPLLLQASRNADSFSARRLAIICLSYLRIITPEVLAALLRLAGDTEIVQKDALAAAARFNRLDQSLGEALPAELTDALTGPSVLRARTAARLLQALGTSQAAQATPGLRRQIVQALAAALQDPGSRRPVWISADDTDGTLDQDLYQTLLRVAGF